MASSNKGPQPEQFAKVGSEHGHQVALFCWAAQMKPQYPELEWMFAIPNGGERNKIVAAHLKAEGVKSDVSDIFLPVPRGSWHGLFIELKRPDSIKKGKKQYAGTASNGQLQFQAAMREAGYGAVVCVGWQEAVKVIEDYLNWEKKYA
jgi:hypothetical protein